MALLTSLLMVALMACGDNPPTASVSGDAIPFVTSPHGRIKGPEIWILEHPEMRVTTGADGHFRFDGLEVDSEVTLVLDHPDYTTPSRPERSRSGPAALNASPSRR